jgi:polyketide biosynthesis 3-hydroxy-3-methylglutaryl-CoA synthase-like enzyme PksG
LLRGEQVIRFGQRDATIDRGTVPAAWGGFEGSGRLVLEAVVGYHRKYRFV